MKIYNGEMCTIYMFMYMVSLCCVWILSDNHRTHLNNSKVPMNKHATKRITFDGFKSHLDYLSPNLMQDVFIDIFGRKKPMLCVRFGFSMSLGFLVSFLKKC